MAITIDGTTLRTLEEQVRENKRLIAEHYNIDRVLADFGIKVMGRLVSVAQLPDASTYEGEYGDAYLVGSAEPYDMWVWTRADVNSGHPDDYWLNIGHIAIEGPTGPQGEPGIQGPRGESTKWRTGVGSPNIVSTDRVNDLYLSNSGTVWQVASNADGSLYWKQITSIKGPQGVQGAQGLQGETGPQGPQGERGATGDVGGFINIIGVVSTVDAMASPATLGNMTKAYLVGTGVPYDLYIQVGESSATAQWLNTGPLNVSTLVSVGGYYVNIWDADTKVDTITYGSGDRVYIKNSVNQDTFINLAASPTSSTIPMRTTGGQVRVGNAVLDDAAVPYAQFKAAIDALQAQIDAISPSKNLFRCDFVQGDSLSSDATEIEVYGEGGTYESTLPFKQICPNCVVGKTYTISSILVSAQADGGDTLSSGNLYISAGSGSNWINIDAEGTQTFTLTQAIADSKVMFDLSYYSGEWGPEYSKFIIKIMLNEGDTALPWEPAIK